MCKGLSESPRQETLVSELPFQAVVKGNKLQALIGSPSLLKYSLSCNDLFFFFFCLSPTSLQSQCGELLRKPPTYHLRLVADLLFLEMR